MEDLRRVKDRVRKGRCPKCGKGTTFVISLSTSNKGWDKEKVFKNFSPKGMKFESKAAMSRYCQQHKLSSAALL